MGPDRFTTIPLIMATALLTCSRPVWAIEAVPAGEVEVGGYTIVRGKVRGPMLFLNVVGEIRNLDGATGMSIRYSRPDMVMPSPLDDGQGVITCGVGTLPLTYLIEDRAMTLISIWTSTTDAALSVWALEHW